MRNFYRHIIQNHNRWIVIPFIALLSLSLLMVSSASMVISDKQFDYPFHYIIRQTISVSLGLLTTFSVLHVPTAFYKRHSQVLFYTGLLLLMLVLVPWFGYEVNGSRRWFHIGALSIQVSEFANVIVIIYLAQYIQKHKGRLENDWKYFIKPTVVFCFISSLLLAEPNFGSGVIVMMILAILLFLAGVRLRILLIFLLAIVSLILVAAMSAHYRMERLTTFLHPWMNQFGSGYQLTQSLIAFGRGGVFGVGLGNSVQKLFYLPEAHTDFLFAVIAEEFGLIGEGFVLILFVLLIGGIFVIATRAQKAKQHFSAFLAYGIGSNLALQTFINIGVNIGLLPTKGLTLPFVSYGGSSMLVNCFFIGLVLRISYELRMNANRMNNRMILTNY